ncbi:MAG TPA: YdcF family protein [Sandaracinaceae bacterium LLY-WYZ-13_1]|nr:YdcF family protein [Sandaracinaceae bacterium LLY-WYZ-13_1]
MRRVALLVCLAALGATGCGRPLGPEVRLPPAPPRPAEAIVVLGNRPPLDARGRVAPETARRVRRGVELFERGLAPVMVVTGGPAPHGGTEAAVMARYARSLGVPDEAILREPRATDTAENARFAVALLCERAGAPLDRCHPSVIVVSSPYHLRRAVRLFECAGAETQWAGTPIPDDIGYQAAFTAYEYGVGLAYVFDDACARARDGRSPVSAPADR